MRSIERIYSVDRTTYVTTDYVETTDYTLVPGGINWVAGQGPALDTPYAVTYRAAPEYFVMAELPQVRHQGSKSLPRRVALRLFEKFPRAVTLKR